MTDEQIRFLLTNISEELTEILEDPYIQTNHNRAFTRILLNINSALCTMDSLMIWKEPE